MTTRNLKIRAALVGLGLIATSCGPMQPHEYTTSVAGAYDTTSRYDMGAASGMLQSSASSWSSPEVAIVKSIIDTVRSSFGQDAANGVSNYYGETLQRDVRGYLLAESPPWAMNISEQLGRVDDQLKTVDIQGSWLVAEKQGGQYEVTQIWSGISVFKNPSCRSGGSLLCEQFHFSTESLLEAEYPIEIISSRAGAIASGQALVVDAHQVEFNYGRLGLYMLINQLLPNRADEGGIGVRDVALAAVNCRGLAGRLAGDDDVLGWEFGGTRIGLSLSQLVGSCEEGVFGSVNRFVDNFNLPLKMDLSGSAQMVDTTRDGKINRLDNGQLSGAMNLASGRSNAREGDVSGEFTAYRVGSFN
ncbi:MAG: hypothetical protein H0U74_17315 [Bradymonadaceae bacterium]|nr:hypothetical protein [Lujinxingiaceae bacterium]